MRVILALAVLAAVLTLSGCGSSGSGDSLKAAVSGLRDTITSYNAARPSTIESTGAACKTALSSLPSSGSFDTKGLSSAQARTAAALKRAYASARQGFADCMQAATTLNFPLMYRADQEISAANDWIRRASSLDQ